MCYICVKDAKVRFSQAPDQTAVQFRSPSDAAAALLVAPTVITTDTVPDDITGTNPVVTVGGPHIISTIDTPGDQDFYKVELQAGVKYNIGMYGYPGGPSGVAQFDSYIELYEADGTKIAYEDGKGRTPSGELYGLDAMLTITVDTTGTYYINARAFDQDLNDDTTTGDTIGDYDLFVELNTDPPEPVDDQYYPMTSPLRSIDWGTQVDGTARNPDGDEGNAPTGNPQGVPDDKGESVGYFGQSTEGKNVIKIYFAKAGDVYTPEDPANPGLPPAIVAVGAKDYEVTAIWTSLREFEKVADIVYVETQNRDEADFHYVTYSGTPGPGISLLGSMSPPQEPDEGLAQFNSGDERWNETNLAQGGFSFVTLIHEFGHGHGLAHPHDTGGNSTIMPGVKGFVSTPAGPVPDPSGVYPNYTRGEFDLNQGVFTMMSYQDGWETSPYGRAPTDVGYGYLGSLMALDIAVIQSKYGVNEDWAKGNDTYVLNNVNAAGTFYSSIWDTGGTDEIVYSGARNANIDLRPATLKYEVGGGGWVSFAFGIHGGFTIANGVTIENATGAAGRDTLIGNDVANVLMGAGGADTMFGEGGTDYLNGGRGIDTMAGGKSDDIYIVYEEEDQVIELAGGGTDSVQSRVTFTLADNVEKLLQTGTASIDGFGNGLANTITGNSGDNLLSGHRGNDKIYGGDGNDRLYGVEGKDTLHGGSGKDWFHFNGALTAANADKILDFSVADDTIYLSRNSFTGFGGSGRQVLNSSAFHQGSAAGDANDRIIYDQASGQLFFDADGAGGAAGILFATVDAGTALTHADFMIYS